MPPEENLPLNPTPEENPSPASPQEPIEPTPENTAHSEPSTMPSEALEASQNSDGAIPLNNDNSTKNEPGATMPESSQVHETSENQGSPLPQTAQIPVNEPLRSKARELLIQARNAIQFRKRKKLDRVMSMFLKQSKITNDEVEKLLHVSDATATRYLSILEKEGKIVQSGKTGKGVSYSRI